MPRFKRSYSIDDGNPLDNEDFAELFSLERSIDRRLAIFLVLFAFVIVGALGSGSPSISSVGFSIGSIICWLIAVSIILTTKKADAVSKEVKYSNANYFASIERKLYSKAIRWILGYIIPVFCSIVLTFGSVASSAGWFNNVWFYKYKIESKVDELKNSLPEKKIQKVESKKPEQDENFTPIDSVINAPPRKDVQSIKKTTVPKTNLATTDSISKKPAVVNQQPQKKTQPPNEHFKPIDKVAK